MIRLLSLLPLLVCIPTSASGETLPGPIPAEVIRIVDGDTVRVRAHIWINQSIEISVRIAGIDAPEIARPDCRAERQQADAAKAEVSALIGADMVRLYNVRLGKYAGRVVADIKAANGTDIATQLVALDLAIPENTDAHWCPATR